MTICPTCEEAPRTFRGALRAETLPLVCAQNATLRARVAELETAIGVMVPTIIRSFLDTLAPDDAGDRHVAEATLARVERAMATRTSQD